MADELKDLIRISDTKANFTGSRIRNQMISMTSDTDQLVFRLASGVYKFISDDTQQVLIAGAQTITGAKTFSAVTVFNDDATINADLFFPGDNKIEFGTSNPGRMKFDNTSQDLTIETTSGDIQISPIGGNVLLNPTSGLTIFSAATNPGSTSLRIPHGVTPPALTDGDMWTTTAGLFVRINGSTVGPLS